MAPLSIPCRCFFQTNQFNISKSGRKRVRVKIKQKLVLWNTWGEEQHVTHMCRLHEKQVILWRWRNYIVSLMILNPYTDERRDVLEKNAPTTERFPKDRGVQNPQPRKISRSEGGEFPITPRHRAMYSHSLSIIISVCHCFRPRNIVPRAIIHSLGSVLDNMVPVDHIIRYHPCCQYCEYQEIQYNEYWQC